jgi:hypothetical protein
MRPRKGSFRAGEEVSDFASGSEQESGALPPASGVKYRRGSLRRKPEPIVKTATMITTPSPSFQIGSPDREEKGK